MCKTLLILAAGLGSRYGSLKQIDKIGPSNERIIDYSVYDAKRAGFNKVVYVIRKSFEDEFKELIIDQLPKEIQSDYICQELDLIPSKFEVPFNRVKPWGTAHALMIAESKINEPFAVINADDFYGIGSFKLAVDFLKSSNKNESAFGLIGFLLSNTLSAFGSVSRAICEIDKDNFLTTITERSNIKIVAGSIYFEDNYGNKGTFSGDEITSMNLFLFTPMIFTHLKKLFEEFLSDNNSNPDSEFQLPTALNSIVRSGNVKVKTLVSKEEWFGLTYKKDKPIARKKINSMVIKNIYPFKLWD